MASNIIEAFVITMGIDPRGVIDGAKKIREEVGKTGEASDTSSKKVGETGKAISKSLVSVRNEVVGLFLTLSGFKGVANMVGDIIGGDAKMGRFASNIGMATRDVGAWSAAVQEMGGNASDAQQALGQMAHVMAQMKMSQRPDNSGILQLFGINQQTATDESAMLMQISRASQRMDPNVFNENASKLGFSPEMIALLRKGPDYLSQNMDKWRIYGDEIAKNAEASQHLQKSFADLRMVLETSFRPAIQGLADFIDNFLGPLGPKQFKAASEILQPSKWGAVTQLSPEQQKSRDTKKAADPNDPYGKGIWGGLKAMWNSDWVTVHHQDTPGRQSAKGGPTGGDNLARYTRYFMAQGFSQAQASGIAAGILAESSGNPNAVNPKSGAFGLGQWLGERKKRLMKTFGSNPNELQQLQFLAWELKGGDAGGRAVGAAGDADSAILAYVLKFMRPQGQHNEHWADAKRDIDSARRFLRGASVGGNSATYNIGPITINNPKDSKEIQNNLAATLKRRGLAVQADGPYN